MQGLFKMKSVKDWVAILIVSGVILIIAAFIVNRIGFGRAFDAATWENEISLMDNHFPMQGINLSDLQTDDIIRNIVQITGAKNGEVFAPGEANFHIQVTDSFDWLIDGAISIMFSRDRYGSVHYYSSQLRIFPDSNEFFLTSPQRQEPSRNKILLRDYLDALKHIPQDTIIELSRDNPAMFNIIFREADYWVIYDMPRVYYDRNGLTDKVNDWSVMFEIIPGYSIEGIDGFTGYGSDVIFLFFVSR